MGIEHLLTCANQNLFFLPPDVPHLVHFFKFLFGCFDSVCYSTICLPIPGNLKKEDQLQRH